MDQVQGQEQGRQSTVGVEMKWSKVANGALLVLPFFLWGTSMVIMEEVMPKTGAMFVVAARLIPGGALIILFARLKGKSFPSGARAWLPIALFGIINGSMFQGLMAEGLTRTNAGIGCVIIDSQPITVAVLAAILYGEVLGPKSIIAMVFGISGLILIEIPVEKLQALLHFLFHGVLPGFIAMPTETSWSIWESGEWWMLLAAQSMAIGTVMIRWVSKFSDPVMAIGWHMVLGGFPILVISLWKQEPGVSGHLGDLNLQDWVGLFYTSVFGSSIATGLFFYNATRGSLTELSTLTLLTPIFAAGFGYLLRNETITGIQLVGSLIVLGCILFVKVEKPEEIEAGAQNVIEAEYKELPADTIP